MANIIDFEDLKQDAGDLRNLQDDDLSGLSKLIQRQLDLDSEIENMEETIKEMKRERDLLSQETIPTKMQELGINETTMKDGSKVTVGLRPKALRLNISKTGLKIDIHERLGGVSYAYLNSPTGERIIVEIDDDNELSTGQDIGLEFDHGAALFFDETTDKRLR